MKDRRTNSQRDRDNLLSALAEISAPRKRKPRVPKLPEPWRTLLPTLSQADAVALLAQLRAGLPLDGAKKSN